MDLKRGDCWYVQKGPCPERTGLRQCNLSCSSSSHQGFDKLEEELRTFGGLVKTHHAIFGEAISDSITQAVIKSQMPAEIRTHLDFQTFARTTDLVNLMASLSKMRTAATSQALQDMVRRRWKSAGSRAKGRARARTRRKGKKNPRARSSRDGVTTAENGVTKLQTVGMEKRNRCTKYKVQLVRPA